MKIVKITQSAATKPVLFLGSDDKVLMMMGPGAYQISKDAINGRILFYTGGNLILELVWADLTTVLGVAISTDTISDTMDKLVTAFDFN